MADVLAGGWLALLDYVGYHVLTCLLPAFLLAGAIVAFVSKEAIATHMGHASTRTKSFLLATVGSFFVAACSCTVIPVSAGLYFAGGSVGSAFIVLWVAPAANILALLYTGAILGGKMVLVRLLVAVVMAFVVGTIMSTVFHREETKRVVTPEASAAAGQVIVRPSSVVLMLLILASLLGPNYLVRGGPYLHKVLVWAVGTALVAVWAAKTLSGEEVRRWLGETWWFVRIIFPLLLGGVFLVGIIGRVLPEQWIQAWLSGSGPLPSFLATLIGTISYFATMTEAPFVDTLMKLGMGPGPALALLLTGPGISLPNILAIGRVFGLRKAGVYVATVVVLGTLAGWLTGSLTF